MTALNLDIGRRIWWASSLGAKEDIEVDETYGETTALWPIE